MKYNNILAPTAIKALFPGLYGYGIAVTTILVLLYCGFSSGKIHCTESHDHVLLRHVLISVVMRGLHSYEYDYSGQKYLCSNHIKFCQFEARVLLS